VDQQKIICGKWRSGMGKKNQKEKDTLNSRRYRPIGLRAGDERQKRMLVRQYFSKIIPDPLLFFEFPWSVSSYG
jgi:hypothetical protein